MMPSFLRPGSRETTPPPAERWRLTPMYRHAERHRIAYDQAYQIGKETGYSFECDAFAARIAVYADANGAPQIMVTQKLERLACGHFPDGTTGYHQDVRIPVTEARAFARWLLTMTEGMEG